MQCSQPLLTSMTTIESVDFYLTCSPPTVATWIEEAVMNKVNIMSVVGSAVPESLRARGLLACWYLIQDGEPVSGPLASLPVAEALSRQMQCRPLNS
ncbi:hypothetical protein ALP73_03953 [Pseudomonas coronafaciens pv. garcae]|nr:hypothetical protein ALQ25_02443 [Pseudomonas coronafaciens pv. atropurpurea]RMS02646.1 hypothetical protein ALP73_03953 [Pseudomonas coronafaciens pv. garcae]